MESALRGLVALAGTQRRAAALLGVSQPSISRWLSGQREAPRSALLLAGLILEGQKIVQFEVDKPKRGVVE